MSVTFVNQGEGQVLTLVLGVGYTLRLYQNDVTDGLTPTQIDALTQAAFTEATFTGYSAKTLTGGSWTITQGDPSVGTYAEQTFTSSADQALQAIYGYYVTRTSDGALVWFEDFGGAINIEFLGDFIEVTPRITLDDGGDGMAVGDIVPSARATPATGRLACNGQAVSRSTYSALFAAIGETYGVGDGTTTFNVPDLRQRFPLGVAASGTGSTLAGTGGSIDHTHPLDTANSAASLTLPASSSPMVARRATTAEAWDANFETSTSFSGVGNSSTGRTSGLRLTGDSDVANPPFLAINYEIVAV